MQVASVSNLSTRNLALCGLQRHPGSSWVSIRVACFHPEGRLAEKIKAAQDPFLESSRRGSWLDVRRRDWNLDALEVDATHRRGRDEDDPAVDLDEPGLLRGPGCSNDRAGTKNDHRPVEPLMSSGWYSPDGVGIRPAVVTSSTPHSIDGDVDICWAATRARRRSSSSSCWSASLRPDHERTRRQSLLIRLDDSDADDPGTGRGFLPQSPPSGGRASAYKGLTPPAENLPFRMAILIQPA